jgi:hypothetical protein
MKKIVLGICLFCSIAFCAAAGEYQTRESEVLKNPKNFTMAHTVESFCIEGHVFVEVAIMGGGSGGGVNVIQVYEEKNGRVVPMRCDLKEKVIEKEKK